VRTLVHRQLLSFRTCVAPHYRRSRYDRLSHRRHSAFAASKCGARGADRQPDPGRIDGSLPYRELALAPDTNGPALRLIPLSLRAQRSNPWQAGTTVDCFAALAMTNENRSVSAKDVWYDTNCSKR